MATGNLDLDLQATQLLSTYCKGTAGQNCPGSCDCDDRNRTDETAGGRR